MYDDSMITNLAGYHFQSITNSTNTSNTNSTNTSNAPAPEQGGSGPATPDTQGGQPSGEGTPLPTDQKPPIPLGNDEQPLEGVQQCTTTDPSGEEKCPCTGSEKTTLVGLEGMPSFTGSLPSPYPIIVLRTCAKRSVLCFEWNVNPTTGAILVDGRPEADLPPYAVSSKGVRRWVREAAEYNGVPHLLLAMILQQENAAFAPEWRKLAQYMERNLTTTLAVTDEYLWDLVPDTVFGVRVPGGSAGLANLTRATLRDAVAYTKKNYCRHPAPPAELQRVFCDAIPLDIPGYDWKLDLYYLAAHLRQLMDSVTKTLCYAGVLNREQLKAVVKAYNGTGSLAETYANSALAKCDAAIAGDGYLYFYEK